MVTIFGKDTCPYTRAAIQEHTRRGEAFTYVNVKRSTDDLQRMLELTGGQRRVPVIVSASGEVAIGFGGT
jgi:glutaredoxin